MITWLKNIWEAWQINKKRKLAVLALARIGSKHSIERHQGDGEIHPECKTCMVIVKSMLIIKGVTPDQLMQNALKTGRESDLAVATKVVKGLNQMVDASSDVTTSVKKGVMH